MDADDDIECLIGCFDDINSEKKRDESEFCDRILPEVMEQTGWKVSNQPSPLSGHIKIVKKGGKYFYFSRLKCKQV